MAAPSWASEWASRSLRWESWGHSGPPPTASASGKPVELGSPCPPASAPAGRRRLFGGSGPSQGTSAMGALCQGSSEGPDSHVLTLPYLTLPGGIQTSGDPGKMLAFRQRMETVPVVLTDDVCPGAFPVGSTGPTGAAGARPAQQCPNVLCSPLWLLPLSGSQLLPKRVIA